MPTKRRKTGPDGEIDALFRLPLAEFTAARNDLAARLTKAGRSVEAGDVKALTKPPATAWAVNQLYWKNPKAIEQLIGVTERVRKGQTKPSRNVDVRELLSEKKRMMAELTERASALLSDGGHAASPDAMRRVSATLDALAVWGNTEGAPKAGRLTSDLDAPGFDALAAVMGGAKIDTARVLAFKPSKKTAEDPAAARVRARAAMKDAEKLVREASRNAERAQTALMKANGYAEAVERQKEEIDARLAEAREQARAASSEAKKAAQVLADAERSLAQAKQAVE
jgi:hypothetical protein